MSQQISLEEAKAKVATKRDQFDAMLRNGYFLPPWGSTCLTRPYMEKVRSGEFYVPKYEHVRLRPCPIPPLKKRIFDEVMWEIRRVDYNFGIKDETCTNTEWLLIVLSTINQEHEFFGKSYIP